MESILLGALAVTGYNSKNKKNTKTTNKYNPKELDKNYNSNMLNKMNTIEKNQAQNLVDSIKKNKPEYFKQFDELTFDNISDPVSINESHITITGSNNNLQRNINLYNGYSNLEEELNYRVIDKENFTHNNMTPNTMKRDYAINDSRASRKLEAFTGVNDYFVPKQEKYNLFEPMKNLTYVDGMPVFTDYLQYIHGVNPGFLSSKLQNPPIFDVKINDVDQEALKISTMYTSAIIDRDISYLNLYKIFCDETFCSRFKHGNFLFFDDHHLTLYGASLIRNDLLQLIESVFD